MNIKTLYDKLFNLKNHSILIWISGFSLIILNAYPDIKRYSIIVVIGILYTFLINKYMKNTNYIQITNKKYCVVFILSTIINLFINLKFYFTYFYKVINGGNIPHLVKNIYDKIPASAFIKNISINLGCIILLFLSFFIVFFTILSIYNLCSKETSLFQKSNSEYKANKLGVILICLLTSFIFITICSRSSFLYPLNDWNDSNCFFTVGKSMANGKILYKDIYEQKGPFLYFLHAIAYWISNDTFLGVYIIEVISFSIFLIYIYKIESLFNTTLLNIISLPIISALILSSYSFRLGDSAEELCLPLLIIPFYYLLKYISNNNEYISYKEILITGVLSGLIFWIKYSIMGFIFGWIIVVFLICITNKNIIRFIKSCGYFLLGFFISTFPWIIYFIYNKAISSCLTVYFYNNIFLYSNKSTLLSKFIFIIQQIEGIYYQNYIWFLPSLIGLFCFILSKNKLIYKLYILITLLSSIVFIYGGGRSYEYYCLALTIYLVLGIIFIITLIKSKLKYPIHTQFKYSFIFVTIICIMISYNISPNTFYMKYKKQDLYQYKFASIINQKENPTLLNYGFLDCGVYTTSNIVPNCKYFCGLNIPLPEIKETQDKQIKNKDFDFIVLRNCDLDKNNWILNYYHTVSKIKQINQYETLFETYYLLEKRP